MSKSSRNRQTSTSTTTKTEGPTPADPIADLARLRGHIVDLELQVADLKPKADAYRAHKDDLGRQKHQAEKAEHESRLAQQSAHEAKAQLDNERELLLARAAELVEAEKTRLVARATDHATELASKAEAHARQLREQAEQAVFEQREAAEQEAARIRMEALDAATASQAATLAKANAEASARRDAGEHEANARLVAARTEAADLLARARAEASSARAEAERDRALAEQERVVAERHRAEQIGLAETIARSRAEEVEQALLRDARDKAAALGQAASERLAAVEAREAEISDREEQVSDRLAEAMLAERRLERRERSVEAREVDVDAVEREAADRAEFLAEAESRLGTAAVARLTEERDEAREMLEESRNRNREIAVERERLARALEDSGGVDVTARLAEIERLRARVGELLAERASMAGEEELTALRAENLRLADLAGRVADAEARCRELQRAQAAADHAVATARDEADRRVHDAHRELARHVADIDRLASEVNAAKAERDELLPRVQAAHRAADDLKSLQIDRDYLEARVRELERTLDDRNRRTLQRAMDRYGKLAQLDQEPTVTGFAAPTAAPPIRTLAQQVQERMAHDGRFYSEHTVRSWMASLAAHRMVLLQGLSGTGKTSLPVAFARAVGGWCITVPVQSGWRDKADLFGFYNTFDQRFRPSDFTIATYQANLPDLSDRPVFLVLDECNLSRVEYYLADLLSELQLDPQEQGRKKVGAVYDERFDGRHPHLLHVSDQPDSESAPQFLLDGRYLALPPNVWIIATANEDESTFEVADKTLDRAGILQMDARARPGKTRPEPLPPVSWSDLQGRFDQAHGAWKETAKLKSWIEQLGPVLEERFEVGIGNRFEDQATRFLPVYEAAGGKREEGLDHLLETRILRKLRRTRDPGRIEDLRAVKDHVQKTWTWGAQPKRSTDLLDKVLRQLGAR